MTNNFIDISPHQDWLQFTVPGGEEYRFNYNHPSWVVYRKRGDVFVCCDTVTGGNRLKPKQLYALLQKG